MSKPKTSKLEKMRTGAQFANHALKHPNLVDHRQSGSHVIARTDNGMVVIPYHNKDLGTGIRRKIIKTMTIIGLGLFVVAVVFL